MILKVGGYRLDHTLFNQNNRYFDLGTKCTSNIKRTRTYIFTYCNIYMVRVYGGRIGEK